MDADDLVPLPGNVPPGLADARDLGRAEGGLPMERMILLFKLSPEAQAQLDQLLAEQQDPASPHYHEWLAPEQFGARFSPPPAALEATVGWLQASGFTVEDLPPGRNMVNFSGTVAQVEQAFRTSIRQYDLQGVRRQANAEDPAIPRLLVPYVEGVVSLHNLPRLAQHRVPDRTPPKRPRALAPGDVATIYDVKPLHQAGLDGAGVAIAVMGRTHLTLRDTRLFRRHFKLPEHPPVILVNGHDPGDLGASEDTEADLDVQWAGAVATRADVKFVVSASTAATDGVDLSIQYAVQKNLAPIMSTSFGQCETLMGRTELAFFKTIWAQAAAQGITSLIASCDSGPAGCETGRCDRGTCRGVSGLASTPDTTAVGGTQFMDETGTYWSDHKAPDQSSALGPIPEQAWNESGATRGGSGLWASGGGASGLYPRPAWQVAPGGTGNPHRTLPDVALTAAYHDGYATVCGGVLQILGGTSCATPAFAGIMALVVQKTGHRLGNINPECYRLGAAQYRGQGRPVFHDILIGNTDVPGVKGYPCTVGYDLATGLGSVDAQALLEAWERR